MKYDGEIRAEIEAVIDGRSRWAVIEGDCLGWRWRLSSTRRARGRSEPQCLTFREPKKENRT